MLQVAATGHITWRAATVYSNICLKISVGLDSVGRDTAGGERGRRAGRQSYSADDMGGLPRTCSVDPRPG
jgi:hypothetical protein